MVDEILPKILECSYCNKTSCQWHKKILLSCSQCRQIHCRICHAFNTSRKILLENSDDDVNNFLNCYIVDFLNLSDEALKNYFPDIKISSLDKTKIFSVKSFRKVEKLRSQVVNQTLPIDIKKVNFQVGNRKRRVFYKN